MSQDHDHTIAVLLPCYNEEHTIGDVVAGFRAALPEARIYVYDNNSTDLTALRARSAGAIVVREPRQGKGNVVRRMFSDIEADIYVMADGDGTYAPEDAPQLVNTLLTERVDMVVGTRSVTQDAGRAGHAIGNRIFNGLYHRLFGRDFTDIFSGYRVFTRRFAKSFPAISDGFEVETEMSVHASALKLPVCEMALDYGRRPEGSQSKLSTYRDGARILFMFAMLLKETRPFRFFGLIAAALLAASIGFMIPVLIEYFATGLVPRMPTWVLSVSLLVMSVLMFVTGTILDSVARGRAETKRMLYLSIAPTRESGERRRPDRTLEAAGIETGARQGGMRRVVAFLAVGSAGFVADAGLLALLLAATPLDPFSARLASIAAAMCLTWWLNRHVTFGASSRPLAVEGMRYGGVGISSALLNYAVYAALLIALPWLEPLAAIVVASISAIVFSYLGYSRLVFDR